MPLGLDVTVPDPAPVTVTFRFRFRFLGAVCCGSTSNVAVQLRAVSIVTFAVGAVPPQSSLQPVNVDPLTAAAVSVTAVPVS